MSLNNNTLYNDNPNQRLSFEPSNTNFMQDATDINSALLALDQAITDFDQGTEIAFDPTGTDLVSTNVESAIKEHNPRIQSLEAEYSNVNLNSASDIKSELFSLADTNNLTDVLQSQIGTNTTNIGTNATDITNLDNRVTTAETDITNLELSFPQQSLTSASDVKTVYESNADTNAFTDALLSKLNGIEALAEVNQTDSEIKTQYENNADTNAFTDAEKTLLSNQSGTNTGDQTALTVPFTTTTTIPSINTRDAIEYVFANSASDAVDVTYDNSTSGLTATEVQSALDEISANTGAGPMETQQVFYDNVTTTQNFAGNNNFVSLYTLDNNFKLTLNAGKWALSWHIPFVDSTGVSSYSSVIASTLTESQVETNVVASSLLIAARQAHSGTIIVEPSVTTDYTHWTMANSTQQWFNSDLAGSGFEPNPENTAYMMAVRLVAPSVGDAGAISYIGGTNVQAELDDHETRITQNETDISTLQGATHVNSLNGLTGALTNTDIDHDLLTNFVSDEHVAHSSVLLNTNANSGLGGGGDITASRNLVLDVNNLTVDTTPALTDTFAFYDGAMKKGELRDIPRQNFNNTSLTNTSTTSGTLASKVSLNFTPHLAGDYLILWSCEILTPKEGSKLQFLEGVTALHDNTAIFNGDSAGYVSLSGHARRSLTAVSTTYDLQFASFVAGKTTEIRNARITAIRL